MLTNMRFFLCFFGTPESQKCHEVSAIFCFYFVFALWFAIVAEMMLMASLATIFVANQFMLQKSVAFKSGDV